MLDTKFISDAVDNLKVARSTGIQVILTLFSFECVDYYKCKKMIQDPKSTQAYIQNGLVPLLRRIR